MKKNLLLAGLCICTMALFTTACDDDDVAQKYSVTITVSTPVDLKELSNLKVVAVNELGDEAIGDLDSLTSVIRMVAGTYTFRASADNANFNFNASIKTAINADTEVNLTLVPTNKQASGIIFKEIYSTGVKSYYFQDSFFELFNNSDTVQFLDGLIVGLVVNGYGSASPWADPETGALPDFYPCSNHTVYFPGTGKDYPLEPGKSVVCATKPTNHSARELSDEDEPSPVDLSKADWDIYIPSSASDVDYPDVPNMLVAASQWGYDFMPSVAGQAFILAKLPVSNELEVAKFAADENNFKKYDGGYANSFCIPAEYVIDAVDIIYYDEEKKIFKTILDKDDSGYTYFSGSADEWTSPLYCGKSLRRKCLLVSPSRVYYQDTNNSSKDFILGGGIPTPGVNNSTVDM